MKSFGLWSLLIGFSVLNFTSVPARASVVYTLTIPASVIATVPEMSGNRFLAQDGTLDASVALLDFVTGDGLSVNADVWGDATQRPYSDGVAYSVYEPGIHYLYDQISALGILTLAIDFTFRIDSTTEIGIEVPRSGSLTGLLGFDERFPTSDFESPGTYLSADDSVLTVSPEPASWPLLSVGLFLVLLTTPALDRCRFGRAALDRSLG